MVLDSFSTCSSVSTMMGSTGYTEHISADQCAKAKIFNYFLKVS